MDKTEITIEEAERYKKVLTTFGYFILGIGMINILLLTGTAIYVVLRSI